MIGDVIFFKKTNSFISEMIANVTNSEFTHVGLIIGYDNDEVTIIESNRFVKTRITNVKLDNTNVIYTIEKSKEVENSIVNYAMSKIGARYDYFQIIGLFLSLIFKGDRNSYFSSKNKLICSELIDLAYYTSGVKRKNLDNIGNITPQELLDVYDLKEYKKEV